MPVDITDQTLQDEVREGLTLVDFWAPWCGPCHMIAPVLEELAEEMREDIKIAKLNVDENQITPAQLGIQGIPTMVLYQDGKPKEKIVGVQPKELLKEYLEKKIADY